MKPSLVEISIPGVPVQWVFATFGALTQVLALFFPHICPFDTSHRLLVLPPKAGHFPLFPLFPTVCPSFTTQNPGNCDGERASLRGFLLEPPGSLSWLSFRRGDDQVAERYVLMA